MFPKLLVTSCLLLLASTSITAQGLNLPADGVLKPRPHALGLALSMDGEQVLVSGDQIRIFETSSGKLISAKDLELRTSRKLGDKVYSQPVTTRLVRTSTTEADRYATGSDDGVIRLWRIGNDQPERELRLYSVTEDEVALYEVGHVRDLAFSPDGTMLASCATILQRGEPSRTALKVWSLATGEELHSAKESQLSWDAIAFSPHGTKLAVARSSREKTAEGTVEVFDVATWQVIRSVPFGAGFASGLAYSSNGETLWLGGGECIPTQGGCRPTGHLRRVAEDGSQPAQIVVTDPSNYFRGISISNDGETFVTGSGSMQCRATSSGDLRWSTPAGIPEIYGAGVSLHGNKAAYCFGNQVFLLDAGTGKLLRKIAITQE